MRIQIGNLRADPVTVNSKLRQDNSFSTILYNIVLNKIIREMKIGPRERVRMQDTLVDLLAYAGDLVLTEESPDRLMILFSRLYEVELKVGLLVNEEKAEYMIVSRRGLLFVSL